MHLHTRIGWSIHRRESLILIGQISYTQEACMQEKVAYAFGKELISQRKIALEQR